MARYVIDVWKGKRLCGCSGPYDTRDEASAAARQEIGLRILAKGGYRVMLRRCHDRRA